MADSKPPQLNRAETEIYLALQLDDTDDPQPIKTAIRDKHFWKYLLCSCVILMLSMLSLIIGYQMDIMQAPRIYNNSVYAFAFLILCHLFLILDYADRFASFQSQFEFHGLRFLFLFLIIAFLDYLLISLSEDNLLSGYIWVVLIEALYYLSLIFFFCTFMAYWKSWSFHCNGKPWIHALLYLSVVGALLLFICRWLHPIPPDEQKTTYWHRTHSTVRIFSSIISMLTLLFVFCVLLGGIGVCVFSEFATYTSSFGIEIAFISFIVLSFLIMLTPLMPGSIIDACGGFIFVILLVPKYMGFASAWFIALVSIVVLHYMGACIQWYMGSWRSVQVWANTTLPVEMLAASDAVLRDAGWFKVGLVGYLFLDTANGLNQGRINMEFWTQLFSEWPAIPNALGLVSFGATIAAPAIGLEGYDWTTDAVPLLIIFSSVVQAIGVTFGTRAMSQCVDQPKYWCAREKWQITHYFLKTFGYLPSVNGWKHDVFDCVGLFDRVEPLHNKYVQKRKQTKDAKKRLVLYEKYLTHLLELRTKHYAHIAECMQDAVEKEWIILYQDPSTNVARKGYFAGDELPRYKQYLQWVLVTCLIVTFWASFYGFYWTSDLAETVSGGFNSLRAIRWYWYCTLFVFIVVLAFINHVEIITNAKSLCSMLYFVCSGCKIHPDIETRFETPRWPRHNDTDDENEDDERAQIIGMEVMEDDAAAESIKRYESSNGLDGNTEQDECGGQ